MLERTGQSLCNDFTTLTKFYDYLATYSDSSVLASYALYLLSHLCLSYTRHNVFIE